MLSVLRFSFDAVAPILLLIALGSYGRRSGMIDAASFKKIDRFNFRFGFPAIMFMNLYDMEEMDGIPWGTAAFLVAALAVLTLIGWALAQVLTQERSRRPVLIMAAFRSNYAIVGLVLVLAVAGEPGMGVATIMQLPTVLYFNIVSTLVLDAYAGSEEGAGMRRALRGLASNPLIQGLLAGTAAVLIRRIVPVGPDGTLVFSISGTLPWLYTTLSYLSRMSTPLALIALGGKLELSDIGDLRRELIAGVAMRLVLAPAVGFVLAALAVRTGRIVLGPAELAMLLAAFGSPMAVASVVMSAEMGADDRLCGQIVVWTSILGLGSMFAITAVLRALGLV